MKTTKITIGKPDDKTTKVLRSKTDTVKSTNEWNTTDSILRLRLDDHRVFRWNDGRWNDGRWN